MKLLITGANGQLGSELKEISTTYKDWNFIFTDIDELDLSDLNSTDNFLAEVKPDYLINCAAYTAVDKAESDSETARLVNALVPEQLAKLSTKYGIHLIQISTDYVFSGELFSPIKEEDETNPPSVYGQTKLEGEKLALENTEAIVIRTSWLYSRFGGNFVKSMLRLGAERKELGVVFDQIGSPTNAADLAKAIIDIIVFSVKKGEWKSGIYHFSNEGVCSWFDFAREIMELGKLKCNVFPIETHEYPLPAPRPAYSVMNKKKIRTTFDLEIPYWKDSLKKVVSLLVENN